MVDPLLSSLCRICNTNPPKYRCPRCSSQTCSLACSKRHKLWSDCNGLRDPTVFKPLKELHTAAGIDHDYNFISSIERSIERTDRHIVEEKRLLNRKDLLGDEDRGRWKGPHQEGVSLLLRKALEISYVVIDRAPKGMKRNKDNTTNWSKPKKCVNWQVEWVQDNGSRFFGKVLEIDPIAQAYAGLVEEERRAGMTPAERREEKKRKAETVENERATKKVRTTSDSDPLIQRSVLQNPDSSAWDIVLGNDAQESKDVSTMRDGSDTIYTAHYDTYKASLGCYFYLHRPYTPSSCPKVLIPLHPGGTLSVLLRNRVLLEFPTIYALSSPPTNLPDEFMLESDYLARHGSKSFGRKPVQKEDDEKGTDTDSDSASDSDSSMEEGEIV